MLNRILCAAALALLSGCESTLGPAHPVGIDIYADDERLGDNVDQVCFEDHIDRFRRPNEQTVILRKGRKEYLIEVNRGCWEMKGAQFVEVIRNKDGKICLAPGERVWVSQSSAVGLARLGPQNCSIVEVREWYGRFEDRPVRPEENPS